MKKAAIIVMFLTILTKVFAYFKDMVMAYYFGTSLVVDAFIISISIPTIIFTFFGSSIAAGYIPKFNSITAESGEDEAIKFSSNILNIALLMFTFVIALICIFPKQVISIFASGFEGEVLEMAINFTRISSLTLLFSVPIAVIGAYLHLKKTFWAVAIQTIPLNIVLIISIVVSARLNDYNYLIYGFVLGSFTQLLILIPSAVVKKFRHKPIFVFNDKNTRAFLLMIIPLFLAIAVNDINQIIDKTLASTLDTGSISGLNYAQKIDLLIRVIVVTPVTTIMFPEFSRLAVAKDGKGLNEKTINSLNIISILIIPATIALMYYSRNTVALLFGRGAFGQDAITLTSSALFFYAIGMLSFGLRQTLTRVFYALDKFKIPLYNSIFAAVINVILNLVFLYIFNMGIGGLALATSISGIGSSFFLLLQLKKIQNDLNIGNYFKTCLKALIASIIMLVISVLIYNALSNLNISSNIIYIITILISIVIYGIILIFVKIPEVDEMKNYVLRKFRLRK